MSLGSDLLINFSVSAIVMILIILWWYFFIEKKKDNPKDDTSGDYHDYDLTKEEKEERIQQREQMLRQADEVAM